MSDGKFKNLIIDAYNKAKEGNLVELFIVQLLHMVLEI